MLGRELRFVGKNGAAAAFILLRDVHGERGSRGGVGGGVKNFERPKRSAFHWIGFEPGNEGGFETQIRRVVVIGVAAFPVRQDDRVRLEFAKHFRDGDFEVVSEGEARIGKAEIAAHFHTENFSGVFGFFQARFRSAARTGFTAREVEDSGAVAGLRHFEDGAAAGELDVIGMSGDGEQVERGVQ